MIQRQPLNDRFNYYIHTQPFAPQMTGANGAEGQLLQVLDACLVDGFNAQTVVATTAKGEDTILQYGTPHGYLHRQLLALDTGEARIIEVIDKFNIVVKGQVHTTKTKLAPLNWESIFGTQDPLKRAYRSKAHTSAKPVLYLDMNLPSGYTYHATDRPKMAMVKVCQDMTELGVPIVDYTQDYSDKLAFIQAAGYYTSTSVNSSEQGRWVVCGNDKYFFVFSTSYYYSRFVRDGGYFLSAFGEYEALTAETADNTSFFLASSIINGEYIYFFTNDFNRNNINQLLSINGNYRAIEKRFNYAPYLANQVISGQSNNFIDTGANLFVTPLTVVDATTYYGTVPRVLFLFKNFDENQDKVIIDNTLLIKFQYNQGYTSSFGYLGFDLGD